MNRQAQQEIDAVLVKLSELCKECGVQRLILFGSALRESWCPKKSDIDFAIEHEGTADVQKLKFRLSSLFPRKVDVVDLPKAHNAYLRQVILTEGTTIF